MARKVRLFTPHSGQQKIIDQFVVGNPHLKWATVVTGRQFGKTLLAQNAMLYWLLGDPGTKGVWASPYNNQSEKVYHEIVSNANELIASRNSMSKRILFKNGSELVFRSLENYDSMRGYVFDYGIIDEASFARPEALKVWRPTFAIHGKKIMLVSTPTIKNYFYDFFRMGEDNTGSFDEYISFKAVSTDNPFFPVQELEAARLTMTEDDINQEYFAMFTDSGGGVFGGTKEVCTIRTFDDKSNGETYAGIDIAVGGQDSTVITVLDKNGSCVFIKSWREGNTSTQIKNLAKVINDFNCIRVVVETNREVGIFQELEQVFGKECVKGFETTRGNKMDIIQKLKKAISDQSVRLPSIGNRPQTYSQFAAFQGITKDNGYIVYGAPAGFHDDEVMSFAFALHSLHPDPYNNTDLTSSTNSAIGKYTREDTLDEDYLYDYNKYGIT